MIFRRRRGGGRGVSNQKPGELRLKVVLGGGEKLSVVVEILVRNRMVVLAPTAMA